MRRVFEARATVDRTLMRPRAAVEATTAPIAVADQTDHYVAAQLRRAVVPIIWSWAAIRRSSSDSWRLVGFSARTTLALSSQGDSPLAYERLMIGSEVIDGQTAADRFESRDLGPLASSLGLTLNLAGDSYLGHRLPSGTSLGIGPTAQWPEYYINWPLAVDNESRYFVSLSDPVSAPGAPAFKHGYEPVYSKLYGVRHYPRGSYEPPMSASVRVVYPYRIGDVWLSESGLVAYVDWLGKGSPTPHTLQISSRAAHDDPEPETRNSAIGGATTAVAISSTLPPVEADLFLIEPGTATIWDSRTWLPESTGLPLTITPDVEEEVELKADVSSLPASDLDKLAADPEFVNLLKARWIEIQRCLTAEAYLAATVLTGSLLEGALISFAMAREKTSMVANAAPRDSKTGATLPIPKWTLEKLIAVAMELQWIGGGILRMADVVRTLRNTIHPWEARKNENMIDQATAQICFDVVQRAIAQLVKSS